MCRAPRPCLASFCLLVFVGLCAASQIDRLPSLIRQGSDSFPSCTDANGQPMTDAFGFPSTLDAPVCAAYCTNEGCPLDFEWFLNSFDAQSYDVSPAKPYGDNLAYVSCVAGTCSSARACGDSFIVLYNSISAEAEDTVSGQDVEIVTGERKIEIDDRGFITKGSCPGGGGASNAIKGVGIASGVVAVAALAGLAVWFKMKGVPAAMKLANPMGLKPGPQATPDVEAPMPPPPKNFALSKVGDAFIARQVSEVARAVQDPKGNPDCQENRIDYKDLPGTPPDLPKGLPMHLVIALDTSARGCSRNGVAGDSRPSYSAAISSLLKILSIPAVGDVEVSLVTYAGDAAETTRFIDGTLGAKDLDSVSSAIKAISPPGGAAFDSPRATALGSMQAVDLGLNMLLDADKNSPHRRRGRILLFNGGGVPESEMTQARQTFSGTSGRQPWVPSHCVVVAGVGPFTRADGSGVDPNASSQLGCLAVMGKEVGDFGVGDHALVIKRIFHETQNPNGFRGPTFNTVFTVASNWS